MRHFNRYGLMQSKLITVLWITLGWSLIAVYQFADSYVVLLNEGALGPDYDVSFYVRSLAVSVVLGGLVGGSAMVFLWERWLRDLNFKLAMMLIVCCYSAIYAGLTWISIVSFARESPDNALEITERGGVLLAVFNPTTVPNYLFWLLVMLGTLFLLFVRDRFGPGMLGPYVTGKYFRPVSEDKVVMFLDLKDSTQIAERLGAERYFVFLNEVFKAATSSILDTSGRIHAYVGDEIIITWSQAEAARDVNCLRCFWMISEDLLEKAEGFQRAYGCTPSFKAGVNAGTVVAGEVGVIKREVVYSGDVLNTAARIRGLCSDLSRDLLVSASVRQLLDDSTVGIEYDEMGSYELRGKAEPVVVYAPRQLNRRGAT